MNEVDLLRVQTAALEQLLQVHEQVAAEQAHQLEDALEFLAIASHELKNPLNVLRGKLELVRGQARAGDARTAPLLAGIDVAIGQTERLMRLVDQLLDISRITAGRLNLEPEELDLSRLIAEVVERLGEQIERGGCEIALRVQPAVVGRWDRVRIEQVLANLLTNAVKYGEHGLIEVSLDADADQATIMVRDHGPGIPAAEQQRIFERFVRAAPNRSEGLGLGLYITRQIVDQHGGRIRVESEPEAGAAFFVSLPLRRSESK